MDLSPAIGADGAIYFGSWDTNFYALSLDDALKGRFPTGGVTDFSPAIGNDGTIYIAEQTRLQALNSTNRLASLAKSSWLMFRANLRQTGRVALQKPR